MKRYLVYKHTSPSGKVYIGISYKTIQERKNDGYGHNARFRAAIKKYGWDKFKHEVVADGLTLEEAHRLERELIAESNSTDPIYGYNISSGGEAPFKGLKHTSATKAKISKVNKGKVVSLETRQRLSLALKGKLIGEKNPMYGKPKSAANIQKQYESHRNQMKPIDQFDMEGKLLATYESINSAARALGTTKQNIRSCLIGRSRHSCGYKWQYHNEKEVV